ncbi:MAG: hypothetical protein ACOYL5_13850 [Phototrophicaceae bacterium]|jgi:hypothetical protein
MLEGLDAVDWHKLQHSYGTATDVPDMLRAMAAVETEILDWHTADSELRHLYGNFQNRLNHQGDVSNAIPFLVRFMAEMISSPSIKNRAYLVSCLFQFTDSCHMHMYLYRNVGIAHTIIDAYRAIRDFYPLYLSLLTDIDWRIRFRAAQLLSVLNDLPSAVRWKLRKQLKVETVPAVQAQILNATVQQLRPKPHMNYTTLIINYRNELEQIVNNHPSELLRFAGAVGWASLNRWSTFTHNYKMMQTPSQVVYELVGLLEYKPNHEEQLLQNQLGDQLIHFDRLDAFQQLGNAGIYIALRDARLQYRWAHILARHTLESVFTRIGVASSDSQYLSSHYEITGQQGQYRDLDRKRYVSGRSLRPEQIEALRAIVNCDPFWEQPTNLFSFFYGLPDDREALRGLTEGGNPLQSTPYP